jgi:divalent metal cation (Fe/Co/Zn/Cd) transporter
MASPIDLDDFRRAVRWSGASVLWTVAASMTAIGAGLATGSLLLVVFGSVGALDMLGSAALLAHFRHAAHHQASSDRTERLALRVIAFGMAAIAAGTILVSAHHLVHATSVDASVTGTAVLGTSVVALAVLAFGKNRVGRRLTSRALVADSHVSAMGASFAAFALIGTIAADRLGWWWLDPTGSLAIAFVGFGVAARHARHASTTSGRRPTAR